MSDKVVKGINGILDRVIKILHIVVDVYKSRKKKDC